MKKFDISDDEIKKQIEKSAGDWVKRMIEKRNIVLSNSYLHWVCDCVDENNGSISDSDFLYKEDSVSKNNSMLLSYLMDEISRLAEEQRVINKPNEENPFESERYAVKIFDRFFEISQMIGQGTVTFVESCSKPDRYVSLEIA